MSKTYLYHSFPRKTGKDTSLGLKVLNSILEYGLLLTPELLKLPKFDGLPKENFIQRRVCFTALTFGDLPLHAKAFGSFSLEFEGRDLRELSALPALYFSGSLQSGKLFNRAGLELIRHLLEAFNDFRRLETYSKKGASSRKFAKKLLSKIHPAKVPFESMAFTLQALLNLCYPTDDVKWTEPLHYYHQHEWKIIPNFSVDGKTWHFPYVENNYVLRSHLIKMNPAFFAKKLNGKPLVDYCLSFEQVASKQVVKSIRRIIAPAEFVNESRELLSKRGLNIPVVALPSSKSAAAS